MSSWNGDDDDRDNIITEIGTTTMTSREIQKLFMLNNVPFYAGSITALIQVIRDAVRSVATNYALNYEHVSFENVFSCCCCFFPCSRSFLLLRTPIIPGPMIQWRAFLKFVPFFGPECLHSSLALEWRNDTTLKCVVFFAVEFAKKML